MRVAYVSTEDSAKQCAETVDRFCTGITIDVLVMSYETVVKYKKNLKNGQIGLVLCDEGHRLKNRNTQTVKALEFLNIPRRIIITGTPIQNNLGVQILYYLF